MSCAICETRKEKRFCPAIHGRICAICCGTEREVTLDCPSECVYLQQARAHEKPRSLAELPPEDIFPQVEVNEGFIYEHEHLITGMVYRLARLARADRGIHDRDLALALSALAKTYETLAGSGLHYEAPLTSLPQQAVAAELQNVVAEYRKLEEQHLGYARLRDSEVLKALVFILRMVQATTSGRPKSRAFIDAQLARFPEPGAVASAEDAGSRIVLP